MEPGIYENIPFEEYLEIDAVNNSLLWLLKSKTPKHAKYAHENPSPSTDEQVIGHAWHTQVLEPDLYHERYTVGPDARRNSNEWKDAAKDAADMGLEILKPEQHEKVMAMASDIRKSELRAYITKGRFEVTLVWEDPETGLLCKGRLDYLREDPDVITDLKSCVDASLDAFARHCYNFGYHQQAAFYRDGFHLLTGKDAPFVFFACEKSEPYCYAAYECDLGFLEIGRMSYRAALKQYAECVETNVFPGYGDTVQMISLPTWAKG